MNGLADIHGIGTHLDTSADAPYLEKVGVEGHIAACWQAQKVAESLRKVS